MKSPHYVAKPRDDSPHEDERKSLARSSPYKKEWIHNLKQQTDVIYKRTQISETNEGHLREVEQSPATMDRAYLSTLAELSLKSEMTRWQSAETQGTETGLSDTVVSRLSRYRQSDSRRDDVLTWLLLAVIASTSVVAFCMLWAKG